MAYCIECGQQLADKAKFCANCGTPTVSSDADLGSKRKTVYEGELHKCPNCGETLHSFTTKCPACGIELRGAKATNAVRELAAKLEEIESKRKYPKQKLFFKQDNSGSLSKTDEQKITLIRNFSIPNTREDIIEFLILAASNIDIKLYGFSGSSQGAQREVSDAWWAKFDQAYQKAKITFGNNPDFQNIKNIYVETHKKIKRKKRNLVLIILSIAIGCILFFILLFGWVTYMKINGF